MYEEDLNGAELEQNTDLTTIAWWEHDETEDAERELRTLRDEHVGSLYICSICGILPPPSPSDGARDLRGGSGDERLGQLPPTLHQVRSHLVIKAKGSRRTNVQNYPLHARCRPRHLTRQTLQPRWRPRRNCWKLGD